MSAAFVTATATEDVKGTILEALNVMREKELAEKQAFKARAYAKVMDQIRALGPVRSYEDVKGVEGIGPKIKAKLEEIFATGGLAAAERAKKAHNLDAYAAFLDIYGIGPAKARALVAAGISSIEELRTAVAKDPKLLNKNQHIGLKFYEDLLQRIPRAEMDLHARMLAAAAASCGIEEFAVVGSYRRGADTSGDIDVLLRSEDPKDLQTFVAALAAANYLVETLAFGEKKFMGISCIRKGYRVRRLDLLLTPPTEFPFALLYFTGSDQFNIAMRKHALTLGYSLNEHGLTGVGGKADPKGPFPSERSIFEFLGLVWKTPAERAAGAAAIEYA
jgi:DNA polymerase/3'-5' exonuclease PolX